VTRAAVAVLRSHRPMRRDRALGRRGAGDRQVVESALARRPTAFRRCPGCCRFARSRGCSRRWLRSPAPRICCWPTPAPRPPRRFGLPCHLGWLLLDTPTIGVAKSGYWVNSRCPRSAAAPGRHCSTAAICSAPPSAGGAGSSRCSSPQGTGSTWRPRYACRLVVPSAIACRSRVAHQLASKPLSVAVPAQCRASLSLSARARWQIAS
jgi:hypothetical protein